jgi:hypothetical protein
MPWFVVANNIAADVCIALRVEVNSAADIGHSGLGADPRQVV